MFASSPQLVYCDRGGVGKCNHTSLIEAILYLLHTGAKVPILLERITASNLYLQLERYDVYSNCVIMEVTASLPVFVA